MKINTLTLKNLNKIFKNNPKLKDLFNKYKHKLVKVTYNHNDQIIGRIVGCDNMSLILKPTKPNIGWSVNHWNCTYDYILSKYKRQFKNGDTLRYVGLDSNLEIIEENDTNS